MKRSSKARAARPDEAGDGARIPLRRALIAAALAVVLGGVLWLSGAAESPPAPSPAVQQPAPAPALPAVAVSDLPPTEVVTLQPDAPAPGEPTAQPAVPTALPQAIVEAPSGHVLQLGVFGAQANAERLRDELARGGFPARIESRVVLGPYPDRAAAEAAQAALKRAGQGGGIVVPPRTP